MVFADCLMISCVPTGHLVKLLGHNNKGGKAHSLKGTDKKIDNIIRKQKNNFGLQNVFGEDKKMWYYRK